MRPNQAWARLKGGEGGWERGGGVRECVWKWWEREWEWGACVHVGQAVEGGPVGHSLGSGPGLWAWALGLGGGGGQNRGKGPG